MSGPFHAFDNGEMEEYRQSAHAVFDLKYDMIWWTKYRKKVPRGRIAERARDLIRQICAAREVMIVRGSVSPDQIHLLLAAPPIVAPAKLAQYIKGRSFTASAGGVSRPEKAIPGTTYVGTRILLRDGGRSG